MTTPRHDTWMPLYWGDYLRDTMHLSTAEHGAYLLMIAHYWTTHEPLPNDERRLRLIARMSEKEWKQSRDTLLAFFTTGDDGMHHKRIDQEMEKTASIIEARSAAGSTGAAKRWQTHSNANGKEHGKPHGKPHGKRIAKGIAKPYQTDGPSQPQPQSPSSEGDQARAREVLKVEGWEPDDLTKDFAAEQGLEGDDLEAELSRFRDYHIARGHERADWNADFRSWLRRKPDFDSATESPAEIKPLTAAERAAKARREGCSACNGSGWIRGKGGMVRCHHGATTGQAAP